MERYFNPDIDTGPRENADQKIRVNSIGPGYIKTPLVMNSLDEATLNALVGMHPIGRLDEAEEVAELILWLGSDKSSFINCFNN